MTKKALLVGINYPGTMGELRGCINDIDCMSSILKKHYKFNNVHRLTDNQATTSRILSKLNWLVKDSKPGDVLYFHYSGHGSQMADQNRDEADRLDEILCPIDLNWRDKVIRDDDMAAIFSKTHPQANLTVTLDCCHSGDGIRGGLVNPQTKLPKPRWIPTPDEFLDAELQRKLLNEDAIKRMKPSKKGMLISGCKSNQTSADAWIEAEKQYMGACTYYMSYILKGHNYKITYQNLVRKMQALLKRNGYTQVPQLYCLSGNPKKLFLS